MSAARIRQVQLAALAGGLVLGLFVASLLVMRSSSAAFAPVNTDNPANTWASGTVVLTDNDGGSTMFNATDQLPGSTGENCLTVTYSGTIPAPQAVRTFAANLSDPQGVAPHYDLVIQEGTGGGFGNCAGFSASSTIFTGTLSTFATTKNSYAAGVGTWLPTPSTSRVYRVAYTLNAATPSAMQGAIAQLDLNWATQA